MKPEEIAELKEIILEPDKIHSFIKRAERKVEVASTEMTEEDTLKRWKDTRDMLCRIEDELDRARTKFPEPTATMVALTEEVGELAKALLDESWENVRKEAIQVACMAIRVAIEGDRSLDSHRISKALGVIRNGARSRD